jgi:hypothetical protein
VGELGGEQGAIRRSPGSDDFPSSVDERIRLTIRIVAMENSLKIVTRLPLLELWRVNGFTSRSRRRELSVEAITNLLRLGPVEFVVADVGSSLSWIQTGDCYQFWKAEAKPHLAAVGSRVHLDEFPGSYCYFASEWHGGDGSAPIVVLEKHH